MEKVLHFVGLTDLLGVALYPCYGYACQYLNQVYGLMSVGTDLTVCGTGHLVYIPDCKMLEAGEVHLKCVAVVMDSEVGYLPENWLGWTENCRKGSPRSCIYSRFADCLATPLGQLCQAACSPGIPSEMMKEDFGTRFE